MFSIKKLGIAITASSLALPFAQAVEQDAIIVTATRTAQTVDATLASVTVITREDIERQQASDLHELLSNIIGIDIITNGGFGKSTNLYMRGTNTSHTLVLIDGVQIGSATLGQVAYQDIPLALIERIEVVRGPRASLYGSEAIGGVIQIFTRKPTEASSINFSAGAGSENTKKFTSGISGQQNKTSYSLQVSHFETEGFNARQNNDPDRDGYQQQSFNVLLKHQFSNTDSIEASILHSAGENDYDGFTTTTEYKSETVQEAFGVKGIFNASTNWQVTLSANQSQDKSNEFEDNIKTDEFNTKRKAYLWQNDIVLNEANLFTIGLEKQDTSISGTSDHSKKSRDNDAVFIQNSWSKDHNELLISLRADDNEAFGNHTTGGISWGQNIDADTRLILSAGTAFKAPSFNDLYFPDVGYAKGNPDILPEESKSYEISLKQKNMEINIFNTTIKNLIDWDNATGVWIPSNVASARIAGIEFQTSLLLDGWNTRLNISLTDPRDTDTGKILDNRSRESLRLDFDKDFANYSLGSTIKAQGKRQATTNVPGYTLLDLRASYKISKKVKLSGKITNALDRDYIASSGYFSPERSVFVSVNYQN